MLDKNILLIDDDNDVLQAYQDLLEMEGYHTNILSDPSLILDIIPTNWEGIIISDIYMPNISGWNILKQIQEKDKYLPVILITGHGDIPMAIEAMKQGAFYFIEKPLKPENLLNQINLALTQRKQYLSTQKQLQHQLEIEFIGNSRWIKSLRQQLQQYTQINLPIFIYGENGTGRMSIAEYLYKNHSPKLENKKRIELITTTNEQELQNYIMNDSAFIIIKNIEYLTKSAQQLLLQYIHKKDNYRLVVLSQYSLQQLVKDFNLLPELYYIFSSSELECPPLSYRTGDIEPLFRHFVEKTCKRLNKKKPLISENFIKQLLSQQWIGNINQLIHTAELYAVGVNIKNDSLYFNLDKQGECSLDNLVEEYERNIIMETLDRFQGKINETAHYLQIPRKKLYLRMKKYGIDKTEYKFID
ncbi:sigma-54-dependent transcriptional regulator [Necropsobacter massiliensis]|uniref:sigma-54-dependent transcriptional regulator n=1 Tax=Necropsobacter massiliensis TaxID=1400001 RepID=UPI00059585F6|nr:sigma-54 dependent transcriptional regulator [Necropsobacter massiliensis]